MGSTVTGSRSIAVCSATTSDACDSQRIGQPRAVVVATRTGRVASSASIASCASREVTRDSSTLSSMRP